MKFNYSPYLSEGAFEFLFELAEDDSQMLMLEIRFLANNPSREPHFVEHDNVGREICGLISGRFCILYHVDHAVKEH